MHWLHHNRPYHTWSGSVRSALLVFGWELGLRSRDSRDVISRTEYWVVSEDEASAARICCKSVSSWSVVNSYSFYRHVMSWVIVIITSLTLSSCVLKSTLGSSLSPVWSVWSHVLRLVPRQMNPSQVFLECASPCFLWTTSSTCSSGWCPSHCGLGMPMIGKT